MLGIYVSRYMGRGSREGSVAVVGWLLLVVVATTTGTLLSLLPFPRTPTSAGCRNVTPDLPPTSRLLRRVTIVVLPFAELALITAVSPYRLSTPLTPPASALAEWCAAGVVATGVDVTRTVSIPIFANFKFFVHTSSATFSCLRRFLSDRRHVQQ